MRRASILILALLLGGCEMLQTLDSVVAGLLTAQTTGDGPPEG